ncbi:MAG TPA: helix-hairpin-helix domain-containing protein [Candidatus Ruthenibacterium avium]|uniref:Helix-hairpin-helix domain-containing protein n=1 Tax=Candidatus Ruthenibacterium avium TaxID=2838751 RepID=A0A9D2M0Y5_9FIRM|nr:helix-hairpin-helix domain-containing protein [Candidatus Ruthenibacterium avium]
MKKWVLFYAAFLAAVIWAADSFASVPRRDAIVWPKHDLIEVNHATVQDWMVLPGIGEKRAQALVDLRERKGSLKEPQELVQAEGISQALVQEITPYLCFEE